MASSPKQIVMQTNNSKINEDPEGFLCGIYYTINLRLLNLFFMHKPQIPSPLALCSPHHIILRNTSFSLLIKTICSQKIKA